MANTPRKQRLKTMLGTLLTAIIATGVVGGFDYLFLGSLFTQLGAAAYPTTTGRVERSSVEATVDSDGDPSHRPKITFSYEVDGKHLQSDTWRYGNIGMSDSTFAERVVAKYPPGSEVTVHYHPSRHDDAVLSTELDGSDAFLMLFMTVPNLLVLGAWALFAYWLRIFFVDPPAGGLKIIEDRNEVRARLPRLSPIVALAAGCFGVPFASIFIAGFALHMAPPLMFVYGVWIAAPVAGLAAFTWQSVALSRGGVDLIVDRVNGTISLPAIAGRTERFDLPLDHVQRVEVRSEVSGSGDSKRRYYATHLSIASPGESAGRDEKVAQFTTPTRAEGFAQWLREQISLEQPVS